MEMERRDFLKLGAGALTFSLAAEAGVGADQQDRGAVAGPVGDQDHHA